VPKHVLYANRTILKYADDTVIVSLLIVGESGHGPIIEEFVWCDKSYLELNIEKTKDMIIDFRNSASHYDSTVIKDQAVDCVESYKYLGTVIDSKLTFEKHCESVCKKGHQRLFCLRKFSRFRIDKSMMILFYHAFVESVLSFSLVSWFGNLSLKNKNSLNQIVRWASKIIGESQLNLVFLVTLYSNQLHHKASAIIGDCSHPLHSEFQLLPSGCQFAAIRCRTKRYRNTFVN